MTTTTNVSVTTYPITIDYCKSLDEMVKAGRYGYVNRNITAEHFPIEGEGEVQTELILVHFDRNIESDDAVKELAAMGLDPARVEHATAFGEKYPDVQREYPIVFLASVWTVSDGRRCVPCLAFWDGDREVLLFCWRVEWSGFCRFAAVRKVPTPAL